MGRTLPPNQFGISEEHRRLPSDSKKSRLMHMASRKGSENEYFELDGMPLPYGTHWQRYWSARSTQNFLINRKVFDNYVQLCVLPSQTHSAAVRLIAQAAPRVIAVESLPEVLDKTVLKRAMICTDVAGSLFDQIARRHRDMYWWISDSGLNMAFAAPQPPSLSKFDALAGGLYHAKGELTVDNLLDIAKELDSAGFALKDQLQPKFWNEIAQHNMKFPKKSVKTFEQAASDRRFVRGVKKRLYEARRKLVERESLLS